MWIQVYGRGKTLDFLLNFSVYKRNGKSKDIPSILVYMYVVGLTLNTIIIFFVLDTQKPIDNTEYTIRSKEYIY